MRHQLYLTRRAVWRVTERDQLLGETVAIHSQRPRHTHPLRINHDWPPFTRAHPGIGKPAPATTNYAQSVSSDPPLDQAERPNPALKRT